MGWHLEGQWTIQGEEDGKMGFQVAQGSAAGSEKESSQGGPRLQSELEASRLLLLPWRLSNTPSSPQQRSMEQPGRWCGVAPELVAQEKGCSGTLALPPGVAGQSWA